MSDNDIDTSWLELVGEEYDESVDTSFVDAFASENSTFEPSYKTPGRNEVSPKQKPNQSIVDNSIKNSVTCPYCHSTKCKKISGASRFVSTGVFGLASSKVGKQWHCNNCKSNF